MVRHALRPARVDTAISSFEAAAPTVSIGGASYRVVLAHCGARARWVSLLIDVRAVEPRAGDGRYAYFRKDLLLSAGEPLAIEIRYDWKESASYRLAGIDLEPDVFWRGDTIGAGEYFLTAALSTREGKAIERLTLRQRLAS